MNLDENTSFFRESFKGFNKDDVAAFIQKLSKDYADNEEKYKEKIARLTSENNAKIREIENLAAGSDFTEQLSVQLNEKNAEIENLSILLKTSTADADNYKDDVNNLINEIRLKDAEILELKKTASASETSGEETANLKTKNAELAKINEDLTYRLEEAAKLIRESRGANSETLNELSTQSAELSAKIKELKSENEELIYEKDKAQRALDSVKAEKDFIIKDLRGQLEQNKTSNVEDEQKIYENVTADLGSIIYSAKKTAEDIVARAKSEAESIIEQANIKKRTIFENNEQQFVKLRETYNFLKTEHEKVREIIENIGKNI